MDDFVIFKLRNIINDIKKSSIDKLYRFQENGLTIKEIALLWMITNKQTDETLIENFYNFHSLYESSKKDYILYYNQLAKEQAKIEKVSDKFITKVNDFDPSNDFSDITPFQSHRNNIVIRFDGKISALPTSQIPMLKSKAGWIKLSKGFTDIPEIEHFFDDNEQTAEYVFKIPSTDKEKLLNKGYIFENKITIPIEPSDTKRIVSVIKNTFKLESMTWNKEYINGELTINKMNFDWNIFAMMLAIKDFYNNTIFIAEDGLILSKKNKFIVKYQKYGPEFSPKAVFFTLSNVGEDLVIKIAKIPRDEDVDFSIKVILFLLSDYIEEEESITDLYKANVSFKSIKKAKKIADKQVKTKTRLEPLKRFDPEIFGGDYKKQCQGASKQPRIPTSSEAKKLLKDKPDEIIEFPYGSKNYYTCEPFEKTKGEINKYPGLIYKDDKYVPCCYAKSHHARPNSPLNKYLSEQTGLITKTTRAISDNILAKDKRLPEFRRGYLPDRLAQILKYMGLTPGEYLRYGVPASQQSVIDAMAMIQNREEWLKTPDKIRKTVLKKLSGSSMLNASAQSYSFDYLMKSFTDGSPITAANFHPTVEYYFTATVIVIDGHDLARPETKFGFISHLRKRKNLIILYVVSGQVEVVGSFDYNHHKRSGDQVMSVANYNFTNYPQSVINKCLNIKRQCYGYYAPNQYKFPRTSELANRCSAQYLDSFGKNRGFIVDGQSIFKPPSAPIAKPVVENNMFFGDYSKLIKEFNQEALYYKDNIVYTEEFAFPVEEEVDLPLPPDNYVLPFIFAASEFIKQSQKSEIKAHNPFIKPLDLDEENIISLTQADTDNYLKLLKKIPDYSWVSLTSLKWSPGKIHWIRFDETDMMVTDLDYKIAVEDNDIGTWSVMLGTKISNTGAYVVYPDGKFGMVTLL